MTFLEVRNTLVSSLAAALGLPVLLSDQVQPEAEVPFIVYSVTAPYASTGELGDHTQTVIENEDGTEALIDNRRYLLLHCLFRKQVGRRGIRLRRR